MTQTFSERFREEATGRAASPRGGVPQELMDAFDTIERFASNAQQRALAQSARVIFEAGDSNTQPQQEEHDTPGRRAANSARSDAQPEGQGAATAQNGDQQ